jgi:drug/metabolite transporter (DMT)-like permease
VRLYLLLAGMVLMWSLNFVIAKFALREIPPLLVVSLRAALAGALILPAYLWRRRNTGVWPLPPGAGSLLLLGVSGIALNQVLFVLGLSRTSVAHAAILIGASPLLVLLFSAMLGHERITVKKSAGLLLALTGVAALQLAPGRNEGFSPMGDLYIALNALTFALFTVLGKRATATHDGITVNTFAYVGGAVALLPVLLWEGARFPFGAVSPAAWMSLLYMALFSSVISYLIFYHALTVIPASRVSVFSYCQPVLATLLAVPLLGEHVTSSLFAGGALVLAGVVLTERA